MVGYMEPNYFSKIFKKITGITASEYKKLMG
ncbi:MAG: Helix-turn-helix domain [Anaerocolumna sp.]|nr:Helix-turn-helix domain [Anaerocolumna sp.]